MTTKGSFETGIHVHAIFVDHIKYDLDAVDKDKPPSANIEVEMNVQISRQDSYGFVRLTVKCSHPDDEPNGHNLEVRLIGAYEQVSNETSVPFEAFLAIHAPAALFAFAREIIFSITSRSPLQPILLDPVNLHEVLERGVAKYRQTEKMES
jgi:preprotein translocase subunit SecB